MKKKKNIFLFVISSLAIIGLIILTDEKQNTQIVTIKTEVQDIIIETPNNDELQTNSIVTTEVIFTESDQNEFEQYIDEQKQTTAPVPTTTSTPNPIIEAIDSITGTPTFTLEISSALLNPLGQTIPKNNFLDIPLFNQMLSLIDEQGNVLVGSAQTGFFGKTTENVEINAEGTVEFWLDNDLIATKKIFYKPNGIKAKTFEMFIDDSITS